MSWTGEGLNLIIMHDSLTSAQMAARLGELDYCSTEVTEVLNVLNDDDGHGGVHFTACMCGSSIVQEKTF